MADQQTIRDIFERNVQTLSLRPSRGLLTFITHARLVDGLRCEIEDGPWRLAADMTAKVGGDDTAPNPGVLGRSALASCLVLGIARWAARMDVPIEALEVDVEADVDARGEIGAADGIRPGYTEVRYAISIRSEASADKLAQLLDLAEQHSPYLDVFGRELALRGMRCLNGEKA
jgi:uncharacterized OsmC-like protein